MRDIEIPAFFHEVFGERQSVLHIIVILLFGVTLSTVLFYLYPNMYMDLPLWRSILAFILVFDIFSGCIANFTQSTNDYYAKRKTKRIVFISIHVHILLVAVLLHIPIFSVLMVWMYTIMCAFTIQSIEGRNQVFVAGLLLSLGVAWMPMLEMEAFMLIVSMLFMVKVLFSFSVNHYRRYGSRWRH
ncbi:hypothetical protein M3689_14900 [Alkalihalophilus marmarensis]|jgi:hypothetical protein|uniref:hypothetical protein n=1 Tax=Alkalihalophilus marmarensis TaxID=521377 RepID=UPI0020409FF3|nr:hypothetical protein [Alkalihalophilus marmarensis]MCM3490601.1 hypothetical protein [Alkalihalophilus marmarensis]